MPTVNVTLAESRWPAGAAALLVPVPPATAHQRLDDMTFGGRCLARSCVDSRHGQRALALYEFDPNRFRISYRFDAVRFDNGGGEEAGQPPAATACPPLPPALRSVVGRCLAEACCEADAVGRIVCHVAARFRYGPHDGGNLVSAACDLLTGNCVDIHGYLLAALGGAEVPAVYNAGYHFAPGPAPKADGMHCWVSSWSGGACQEWDVAHHLKWAIEPLRPGLNPAGGTRFAVSRGMDLSFCIGGLEVTLGHLAQPVWVFPGGRCRKAEVEVTLAA